MAEDCENGCNSNPTSGGCAENSLIISIKKNQDLLEKKVIDINESLDEFKESVIACCEETNGNIEDVIDLLDEMIQNNQDCCESINEKLVRMATLLGQLDSCITTTTTTSDQTTTTTTTAPVTTTTTTVAATTTTTTVAAATTTTTAFVPPPIGINIINNSETLIVDHLSLTAFEVAVSGGDFPLNPGESTKCYTDLTGIMNINVHWGGTSTGEGSVTIIDSSSNLTCVDFIAWYDFTELFNQNLQDSPEVFITINAVECGDL